MRIGLDVDDTSLDYVSVLCKWHNITYNTSLKKSDIVSYNLWKSWGGTREEAIKKIHDFQESDYFNKIKPMKGAIEGINKLSKDHELYVLTSRSNYFTEKTKEQLLYHFGDKFLEFFFTNNYSNSNKLISLKKSDICLKNEIELIVDDNFETAVQCADVGIRVLLMTQPWNKGKSYPNVERVNNWKEILEKI